jgi:hypothetical protein
VTYFRYRLAAMRQRTVQSGTSSSERGRDAPAASPSAAGRSPSAAASTSVSAGDAGALVVRVPTLSPAYEREYELEQLAKRDSDAVEAMRTAWWHADPSEKGRAIKADFKEGGPITAAQFFLRDVRMRYDEDNKECVYFYDWAPYFLKSKLNLSVREASSITQAPLWADYQKGQTSSFKVLKTTASSSSSESEDKSDDKKDEKKDAKALEKKELKATKLNPEHVLCMKGHPVNSYIGAAKFPYYSDAIRCDKCGASGYLNSGGFHCDTCTNFDYCIKCSLELSLHSRRVGFAEVKLDDMSASGTIEIGLAPRVSPSRRACFCVLQSTTHF